MTNASLESLRYPIGKLDAPNTVSKQQLEDWISILEYFPERLTRLVTPLSDTQLDTPYRPDGWTVRQVVHHVSDSHHHSYARFKWALTEDKPVIKAYYEDRWAALEDTRKAPIAMSLAHLSAVHVKLVYLLKRLSEEDLDRRFIHPENNREISLKHNIGMYAWHSNHHYAHIENLLKRNGWV